MENLYKNIPCWDGDQVIRVINQFGEDNGMRTVPFSYVCKWGQESFSYDLDRLHFETLTELEYFEKIMKPQGWEINDDGDYFHWEKKLFIEILGNPVEYYPAYPETQLTKEFIQDLEMLLEHKETLEAIAAQ